MVSKKKVTISWSGGKDSAFALYKILLSGEYDVVSLHTIINSDTHRVGMHGVKERLIELQAEAIGIPLVKLYLDSSDNNLAFEKLSKDFYERCKLDKITDIIFGDIYLEDLKRYREDLLSGTQLAPIFPLWQSDTRQLIDDFINVGFKTLICSADASYFGKEQLGKTIDPAFVNSLPASVDPCGERGEFHTYVYDGPVFKRPVSFIPGDVVLKWYDYQKKAADNSVEKLRTAYWFQDFLPLTAS
jgi:uncharacterized protein (TIGR00290 family)